MDAKPDVGQGDRPPPRGHGDLRFSNDTLKGQLSLEQHGGRTHEGIAVRIAQRILALAAAIWHNFRTSPSPGP